ncbi:unnamed protein product [Phytomonas sp. Hart1]|nr:unnamed protein product [Phytomonas sp. Hart1]|eukprot:CCW66982.1 unnamed protein product [Phytomonas sp. isolate Hart1]
MGIAGFFLWLQRWYSNCIEDVPQEVVDAAIKGKSLLGKRDARYRYDNFYVDMNGLIHPCCHDTHPLPEPETEEEMFERIFEHLDLLVKIARPRKCLILCIDGVAPRSKMNQQRSRRFRAAEERLESDEISKEVADEIEMKYKLPRPLVRGRWDHNVITPSTAFMERLGVAIKWFIMKKINEDIAWKHLAVVFSDAHTPGEGEHKIMQYIRSLRSQPGYHPRTTHLIQGMDADLICLGLSTHEQHVSIFRNQLTETFSGDMTRFCHFNLSKFREALMKDFSNIPDMKFERVLDDFIFLCFFVGNDFLPHIPLISIKTKGIELLVDHYVRDFNQHSYLTKGGEVYFHRLATFLRNFVDKRMKELQQEYRSVLRSKERAKRNVSERLEQSAYKAEEVLDTLLPDRSNAQEVSDKLLSILVGSRKEQSRFVSNTQPLPFSYLTDNYRDQYYNHKFGWDSDADREVFESNIRRCCAEYLRGTQWVMRYYTKGCPSWEWYYPFYYAPLLQDLAAFTSKVDVTMHISAPLHPVEQLLAVLPRLSVEALPTQLHQAVNDEHSVLGCFYPDKINVDYSEADFSYQGVLRIPFIDSKALSKACQQLIELEEDVGTTLLFLHESNPLCSKLYQLLKMNGVTGHVGTQIVSITADIMSTTPIAGPVSFFADSYPLHSRLKCPDPDLEKCTPFGSLIEDNATHCFLYDLNTQTKYNQSLINVQESSKTAKVGSAKANKQERSLEDLQMQQEKSKKRTKRLRSTSRGMHSTSDTSDGVGSPSAVSEAIVSAKEDCVGTPGPSQTAPASRRSRKDDQNLCAGVNDTHREKITTPEGDQLGKVTRYKKLNKEAKPRNEKSSVVLSPKTTSKGPKARSVNGKIRHHAHPSKMKVKTQKHVLTSSMR